MLVYLGHTPGVGAYGVVDPESGDVLFRGTLQECNREAVKLGYLRP